MKKKQYQIPFTVVESTLLTNTICDGSNPPTHTDKDGNWEAPARRLYV